MCGVRSEAIQRKLLAEDGPVARAQELGQGMEAAERNAREWKGSGRSECSLDSGINGLIFITARKACYHCGCNHLKKDCKLIEGKCHKCGKTGYIARSVGQA